MKILRKRLILGVLALALATGVSLSAAPSQANAMMPACDSVMDCIHTAHWYYFLR
ncbi:hypothetical protein ACFQI7_33630 [Paenibacillus allorhizosphaerae]|uniref:Uncharacterized protein n=1 Tax=Paenibacillus allorhizosphaerae TaxID=2849866 RepID=A0ABN7U0P3_9BACL|nr:hypothetical protein [Paenibacillus allorhizosphaerae]CAG7657915.1 hypothetical protein PAECIP111802_06895 [Paenibacillus allorhizosphaerae]